MTPRLRARPATRFTTLLALAAGVCAPAVHAQSLLPPTGAERGSVSAEDFRAGAAAEVRPAHPADLAFEQGRWSDAIAEFRALLDENPADRVAPLRIAMAQRELGRHGQALETLEAARVVEGPEAMIEVERARNLIALGRPQDALDALYAADQAGLRAYTLLEQNTDFDAVRDDRRFRRVLRNVRARTHPCTEIPESSQLDFWLGRWEVRAPNGQLLGFNTITKRDGDCALLEQWEATNGGTGTSVSFFVPSRGQWRHVWTGSGGAFVDVVGGLREDGAMHMEGTIEYVSPENVVAFRVTWTPGANGVVRQRMEQFDVVTGVWTMRFDGFFRRVDGPQAATTTLR